MLLGFCLRCAAATALRICDHQFLASPRELFLQRRQHFVSFNKRAGSADLLKLKAERRDTQYPYVAAAAPNGVRFEYHRAGIALRNSLSKRGNAKRHIL